jgi:hypothetical protein
MELKPSTAELRLMNHTGRELELMLEGRKPLAVFYAFADELPDEQLIPEERFSAYVSAGRFVRDEITLSDRQTKTGHPRELKYVFFAKHEEGWRIRALALVIRTYHHMGHTEEGIERVESALLGYTEAEIDAWCNHQFPGRAV